MAHFRPETDCAFDIRNPFPEMGDPLPEMGDPYLAYFSRGSSHMTNPTSETDCPFQNGQSVSGNEKGNPPPWAIRFLVAMGNPFCCSLKTSLPVVDHRMLSCLPLIATPKASLPSADNDTECFIAFR